MAIITTDYEKASDLLVGGKIGIVPSDTIYGISCLAKDKVAVERIYDIKGRDEGKPFIILISSEGDVNFFGCEVDDSVKEAMEKYWPGPVTIILECENSDFEYLHRGRKSLAFRLPNKQVLAEMLRRTGPLISTSANKSGQTYAKSVEEAERLFGESVDFYLDEGGLEGNPSRIIKFVDGKEVIIR